MEKEQFEALIAAILAISEHSPSDTRKRFNQFRQNVCDDLYNIIPSLTPDSESHDTSNLPESTGEPV